MDNKLHVTFLTQSHSLLIVINKQLKRFTLSLTAFCFCQTLRVLVFWICWLSTIKVNSFNQNQAGEKDLHPSPPSHFHIPSPLSWYVQYRLQIIWKIEWVDLNKAMTNLKPKCDFDPVPIWLIIHTTFHQKKVKLVPAMPFQIHLKNWRNSQQKPPGNTVLWHLTCFGSDLKLRGLHCTHFVLCKSF